MKHLRDIPTPSCATRTLVFALSLVALGCDGGDDGTTETASTGVDTTGETSDTGTTTGAPGLCTPAFDCEAAKAGFTACGGDIEGAWALETICTLEELPDPMCADALLALGTGPATGTITFMGGTVSYVDYAVTQIGYSRHSLACGALDCATIEAQTAAAWESACCEMIDDDICECHASQPMPLGDFDGEYTVDGATITIGGGTGEYCVDGDVLQIRDTDEEGIVTVQTLNRL